MRTIILLISSNIFMTIAWYWHLRFKGLPLWKAIIISWCIALVEYCLMVPANRNGYMQGWSGFQLKIVQELITLLVFTVFAVLYLKDSFLFNYLIIYFLLIGCLYFGFNK